MEKLVEISRHYGLDVRKLTEEQKGYLTDISNWAEKDLSEYPKDYIKTWNWLKTKKVLNGRNH